MQSNNKTFSVAIFRWTKYDEFTFRIYYAVMSEVSSMFPENLSGQNFRWPFSVYVMMTQWSILRPFQISA